MASDPTNHERRAPGSEPDGTGASQPTDRREPSPAGPDARRVTRAGMIWTAVVAALVLFVLLVVFFIQNQDLVIVAFLGFSGAVPLGLALFIAAVAGGVLVAIVGAARIIQLRAVARRARHAPPVS